MVVLLYALSSFASDKLTAILQIAINSYEIRGMSCIIVAEWVGLWKCTCLMGGLAFAEPRWCVALVTTRSLQCSYSSNGCGCPYPSSSVMRMGNT